MKIKEFIKNTFASLTRGVRRFPISTLLSLFSAFVIITEIYGAELFKHTLELIICIVSSILANILLTLCKENKILKINTVISIIGTIIFFVVDLILLKKYVEDIMFLLAQCGTMAVLTCLIAFMLYRTCDKDRIFAYLAHHLIFTMILIGVLCSGVCIVVVAFSSLVIGIDDIGSLLASIITILYVVIEFNLMLSYIPNKDDELKVSKEYSLIINRVALFVYLGLIVVLYAYLGKILITWVWPSGRVNYYVSAAILLFCCFYLSARTEQKKLNKAYLKACGIIMIPLMIMQAIGIYIRVSAYGLTILRYISIVLNIIGLVFVVDSIFFKKITWVFAAMAIIIAIVTIGPLNIINVPNQSQLRILKNTLKENGMLVDGKIVANSNISQEAKDKIISAYDYLDNYVDILKEEDAKFIVEDFEKTYGFDSYHYSPEYEYVRYVSDVEKIDVFGYKTLKEINQYEISDGKLLIEDCDFTDYMNFLINEYGLKECKIEPYYEKDNYKLCINYIEFKIDLEGNVIDVYSVGGYILEK